MSEYAYLIAVDHEIISWMFVFESLENSMVEGRMR